MARRNSFEDRALHASNTRVCAVVTPLYTLVGTPECTASLSSERWYEGRICSWARAHCRSSCPRVTMDPSPTTKLASASMTAMRISSQVSSRNSRRSSVFEIRKVRGCAENQTSISWFLCRWLKVETGLVQYDVVLSNIVNVESLDSPERIEWLFKSSDWHAPKALYLWPAEPTRSSAIRRRSPMDRMLLLLDRD